MASIQGVLESMALSVRHSGTRQLERVCDPSRRPRICLLLQQVGRKSVVIDEHDYRYIEVAAAEEAANIATITLNRPRYRNAQNRGLLLELNSAFTRLERDDSVAVIILNGAGQSFSSGHDLGSADAQVEMNPGAEQDSSWVSNGGSLSGVERTWRQEWHYFLDYTRKWRDLRKITIASVHGPVYSAGLMLMWACDLIVADESAMFADVVGARLGMAGVEYFAHPWEFGPRRAKELLLTGDALTAEDAYRIGMVSKVFPVGQLEQSTLAFAQRIAKVPTVTAIGIKDAVNQAQDNQGFQNALKAGFSLHQMNHAHWQVLSGGKDLL